MQPIRSETDAKDALLDWLETHGGVIVCAGDGSNLAALSDSVMWGQRFHSSCGRLLAFLRRHGVTELDKPERIIGFTSVGIFTGVE